MKKIEIIRIATQLTTGEQLEILSGEMRKKHGIDTSLQGYYNTLRFRGISDFYAQVAVFFKAGKLSVKPTP